MVVAGLFFLVPLFLAVVVIGKFIDVQHTTNMGSRYATWERTVWYEAGGGQFNDINAPNRKSAGQIHAELAVRLFNDRSRNVSVISDTDKNATTFANGIDPLWRDNANVGFLRQFNQAGTTITNDTPKRDAAGRALDLLDAVPVPPAVVGSLVPPVPTDTMATTTVSLREVARDSQAYQRLWPQSSVWSAPWRGLDFRAPGGIVSNTWGANGSGATRDMVALSVPTAQGLGKKIVGAVEDGMRLWDSDLPKKLDVGKIAVDVVPQDRLR